tara:strand:+ start:18 stop:461 length:444 start_codon:yes stop_codon:yes gene_type:complete
MKMNRETIEREAKELQDRARVIQAGLQTMKNLQKCLVHGHRFDLHAEADEFHQILQMGVRCSVCGAETELFEDIALEMPDDEMKVGGLACLGLDEIDVEEPEEEEAPIPSPMQQRGSNTPLEHLRKESDGGSYTVDVSSIVGKHKEE